MTSYWEVRSELLSAPMAVRRLRWRELRRAAWFLDGHPRDLRLFGMGLTTWYVLGIRVLGRTVVELTRDPHARFLAEAAAGTLHRDGHRVQAVVDPFVGSGNALFHAVRATQSPLGVGVDASSDVIELTRQNFKRLRRLGIAPRHVFELHHGDWSQSVEPEPPSTTLVLVDPPWAEAFTEHGLDLRKTGPPVLDLLTTISHRGGDGPLFALVKTHPQIVAESVDEILAAFPALETVTSGDPEVATKVDYLLLRLR